MNEKSSHADQSDESEPSELSVAIRAAATRHEAPAHLRERIVERLRAPPNTRRSAQRPGLLTQWRQWRQWLQVAAALACGVLISSSLMWFAAGQRAGDHLAGEVIAGHVRSLMANHLADVASSDQHTVKPWFNGKLDFSPPVPDLAGEGYPLLGGRLDYIDQRSVAALIYKRQQHAINLFVWPAPAASESAVQGRSQQGFNIAQWRESGMQFWAVSDLNAPELSNFVERYRKKTEP